MATDPLRDLRTLMAFLSRINYNDKRIAMQVLDRLAAWTTHQLESQAAGSQADSLRTQLEDEQEIRSALGEEIEALKKELRIARSQVTRLTNKLEAVDVVRTKK